LLLNACEVCRMKKETIYYNTKDQHLIEVQTHAGHSTAFNMPLHSVTL